ncbi:hypothetical protein WR25_23839 [Diploscapter pachys]|uniref:Uncharacterized protein n=1 Tax=Diploscapter pachys TaxID=2018661 RepID=A0A2A2J834_9BILA|nr:hypothetical protein WR25_23839 [Diploscapter pachys]
MPSIGVGIVELIGYSIFEAVGPFYSAGLLCVGCSNIFVYMLLNSNMKSLAKQAVGLYAEQSSSISTPRVQTISISR